MVRWRDAVVQGCEACRVEDRSEASLAKKGKKYPTPHLYFRSFVIDGQIISKSHAVGCNKFYLFLMLCRMAATSGNERQSARVSRNIRMKPGWRKPKWCGGDPGHRTIPNRSNVTHRIRKFVPEEWIWFIRLCGVLIWIYCSWYTFGQ